MNCKPLTLNGIRLAQAAMGMSPADFPVGSVQSRAIARVVLDQAARMKPRRSQYEEDALAIYRYAHLFLNSRMSPGLSEVEASKIYREGRALNALRDTEASVETSETGDTGVLRLEEIINSCLERAGDEQLQFPPDCTSALRKQIVFSLAYKMLLGGLEQAWQRQLPELPFPIRVDNDEMRVLIRRPTGNWEEAEQSECRYTSAFTCLEEIA